MPAKQAPTLSAEEILNAEFQYIASTANQANDDRSSVVSFFIIAVGSPLAAFLSADLAKISDSITYILFTGLFLILSILGLTTTLQLARLRGAWYESMLAMNHMKEFLVKNSDSDISGAFRWTFQTAPAKFKMNSVSFYQTLEVAILSGLLFGAFIFFLSNSLFATPNQFLTWLISAIGGICYSGLQLHIYRRLLR